MIQYDPRAWPTHLVTLRGSVVPAILSRVLVVAAVSAAVMLYHTRRAPIPELPNIAHGFVGLALGLLLVFRTNSAYDRFWEGRKRWGMIVNRTRDLARQVLVWIDGNPQLRDRLVRWVIAFAITTKRHLRGEREAPEILRVLPQADLDRILAADHMPLYATEVIARGLREARDAGELSDYRAMALDANLTQFLDDLGACERILKTPMPFAYVMHLRRFLAVWCLTLPFVLVHPLGWAQVPAIAVIAYALLGIEEIGVQIEDPFGHDHNDLPLDDICATIEKNCLELLERDRERGSIEPAAALP